jgi:tetratricopeptide (TPR) repeat protein
VITPDVASLAALADLYAKAGNEFLAKTHRDAVESADTPDTPFARALVLYYCDHDRKLPRALELAEREFAERKDVYGHDALAWAKLKNGKPAEAEQAITEALKLGTRDAMLYYHAGMIALARGDKGAARDRLKTALAINPHHAAARAAMSNFQ